MLYDIGKAMKNFHLPLPERTNSQLRADAQRKQLSATTRHDAIAAYAAEVAGTALDLDPDLEASGIDHLRATMDRD